MAPLHDAAREGDVESIQLILDASSNPDALIDQPEARLGWTALHCAVTRGRVEAVQLLVKRGAWVDKANLNQLTPLMSAVQQHRRYEIIHALVVDGGANVLQRNHNNTPLLEIAEKSNCDDRVMSLLREHAAQQQAEVDAKKEEAKRKRAEAAAKRKAEREANGGVAPKKKKGRKGAKKKNPPPKPKQEPKESAADDSKNDDAATKEGEEKDDETGPNGQAEPNEQQSNDKDEAAGNKDTKTSEEKTKEKTQEESTNKAPFPFLQDDNQEVIGAVKLMVVQNGTTVVREESVDLYAESGGSDGNEQDEDSVGQKVIEAATKLTKQMEAWNPDQPAFAFFIPPPELEAGQETLQAAMESNASLQEKPQAGALLAHGLLQVKDAGNKMEVRIKNIVHARKTAWTNRYYYNFGRVDSKRLAKIKAATNALKAQTVKDTICEVKFYTEDRAWYWPTVLLVGECKKVPGALFGIKFDCIEQEHHHHGN